MILPGHRELQNEAIRFFKQLQSARIPKIAIENPRPQRVVWEQIGRWTQVLEPYYFGDPYTKATCLWLKNTPPLIHSASDTLFEDKTHTHRGEFYRSKTSKRTWAKWYSTKKELRSVTFPGIANAMAEQWG